MKVITCFSYKGGAGRTVAAANIAAALASKRRVAAIEEPLDRKVALFDLDVFSAGTHRVFEISNTEVQERLCVQDFLLDGEITPEQYREEGGIRASDDLMKTFRTRRGGEGNCRDEFTFFPATPDPARGFVVAKYHENLLYKVLLDLEARGYDYLVFDGEAGARAMADIAIRLSDVLLMFFRLTWQHIDGTLNAAVRFLQRDGFPPFYLVPTCVPLISPEDGVYLPNAPGLSQLEALMELVPNLSGLLDFARKNELRNGRPGPGHFVVREMFIHESLILKGAERIVVYDATLPDKDRARTDYYQIAAEISRLEDPET